MVSADRLANSNRQTVQTFNHHLVSIIGWFWPQEYIQLIIVIVDDHNDAQKLPLSHGIPKFFIKLLGRDQHLKTIMFGRK